MPVVGDDISKNLNKELKRIIGATRRGMLKAGHFISLKSKEGTPVDTGNLRGSTYVSEGTDVKGNPIIEVGLTAEYAVAVHENLEVKYVTGSAKFLQRAVNDNRKKIRDLVVSEIRGLLG